MSNDEQATKHDNNIEYKNTLENSDRNPVEAEPKVEKTKKEISESYMSHYDTYVKEGRQSESAFIFHHKASQENKEKNKLSYIALLLGLFGLSAIGLIVTFRALTAYEVGKASKKAYKVARAALWVNSVGLILEALILVYIVL